MRGGRTTKIRALCDVQGRPHAILLTGGNIADITAAARLVSAAAPSAELVGDKGYDANQLRRFFAAVCLVSAITDWASLSPHPKGIPTTKFFIIGTTMQTPCHYANGKSTFVDIRIHD